MEAQIKAMAILLAIYGGLWIANTLIGIKNSLGDGYKWDWGKFWDGILKGGLGGIALAIGATAIALLPEAFTLGGIMISDALKESVSMLGIIGSIGSGVLIYAKKFTDNVKYLFDPENKYSPKLKINDPDNWNSGLVVFDVDDLPETLGTHGDPLADGETGQGAVNSYASADDFYNATIGRGFDIDGWYGAQCWDLGQLFWKNQVNRGLITKPGGGGAIDCWDVSRNINAGSEFELISDKNAIRKGDWIIFRGGQFGHIGMAMSGNQGNYVRLLGQNQGGTPFRNGGSTTNVINMSLNNFAGAFRFKGWNQPAPAVTKPVDSSVVAAVLAGKFGNEPHRSVNLRNAGYDPVAVQKEVNAELARQAKAQPVAPAPVPEPTPSPEAISDGIKVGDIVRPTKLRDYNGTPLVQYDDTYTVTELNGDRAVLMARNQVWAAMHVTNLEKV